MPGKEIEDFVAGKKPEFNPVGTKFIHAPNKTRYTEVWGQKYSFDFVAREDWGARKPVFEDVFSELIADVVINWTDTESCNNLHECIALLQKLQKKHIDEGETDIRQNFLVGGDGQVYEGRGWHTKPPKVYEWPEIATCCITVAHIGKRGEFPPKKRAYVAFELIDFGTSTHCLQEHVQIVVDYFDQNQQMTPSIYKYLYEDD